MSLVGLLGSVLAFQLLGERVLPLRLGFQVVGATDPVRAEFKKLISVEGLVGHTVAVQDSGERLGVWLPSVVKRKFRLRGMCVYICICIYIYIRWVLVQRNFIGR